MLPTVDFCGLTVTRLIIGANPFGGYSHQNRERDQEMVTYYTPERIKETWDRAWAARWWTAAHNDPRTVDWLGSLVHEPGSPTNRRALRCGCCVRYPGLPSVPSRKIVK